MGHSNNSNFVKNTLLRIVFSTLFSVFGYPDETMSLVFYILQEQLMTSHTEVNYRICLLTINA